MEIIKIAGIALTAMILAVIVGQYHKSYAHIISIAGALLIFAVILPKIQPAFSEINTLLSSAHVNKEYISILIKSLGVCFVAQLTSDACRDAGETAIASNVELAGKFAVLIIALPLFGQVAQLALKLMS